LFCLLVKRLEEREGVEEEEKLIDLWSGWHIIYTRISQPISFSLLQRHHPWWVRKYWRVQRKRKALANRSKDSAKDLFLSSPVNFLGPTTLSVANPRPPENLQGKRGVRKSHIKIDGFSGTPIFLCGFLGPRRREGGRRGRKPLLSR